MRDIATGDETQPTGAVRIGGTSGARGGSKTVTRAGNTHLALRCYLPRWPARPFRAALSRQQQRPSPSRRQLHILCSSTRDSGRPIALRKLRFSCPSSSPSNLSQAIHFRSEVFFSTCLPFSFSCSCSSFLLPTAVPYPLLLLLLPGWCLLRLDLGQRIAALPKLRLG